MVLELGGGAQILRALGWIFWAAFAIALVAALWIPRRPLHKVLAAMLVVSPLVFWTARGTSAASKFQQRQAEAERRFQEHCKTAGVRIYKTVSDVEGVLLMKRRTSESSTTRAQYAMVDPYGADIWDDGYAETMLWARSPTGRVRSTAYGRLGYQHAVLINQDGRGYTRYERTGARVRDIVEISRTPTTDLPRYGVTFEDISSREDRDHWIAGGRLSVVDTMTGEILAERIGWMFDRGLGGNPALRSPWGFARYNACPAFPTINDGRPVQSGQTRDFVEQVLLPSQEKRQ